MSGDVDAIYSIATTVKLRRAGQHKLFVMMSAFGYCHVANHKLVLSAALLVLASVSLQQKKPIAVMLITLRVFIPAPPNTTVCSANICVRGACSMLEYINQIWSRTINEGRLNLGQTRYICFMWYAYLVIDAVMQFT
jgi:hypothetical protein